MPHPLPRPTRRLAGLSLLAVSLLVASAGSLHAAPWVVINEIHYQPLEGPELEFVELHLKNTPRADFSGWRIEGEIDFEFPPGTIVLPGEFVVVARDPAALAARYPHLATIYGPCSGKLDNKGGRITLVNDAGATVCETRYRRDGLWTSVPAGTGHSLSLSDPALNPANPRDWVQSVIPGGTPGVDNRIRGLDRTSSLVAKGDVWRFFRGRSQPPDDWTRVSFDDSTWESGPSGFGYGDDDDATVIDDMRGSYLTLYLRREFNVENLSRLRRLILEVEYDDGFVAYLNGAEVKRATMDVGDAPVRYDTRASENHEADHPVAFDLGHASSFLVPGENVLAIEVHNSQLDSSDLSLAASLESRESARKRPADEMPRINEVLFTSAPGATPFVEIYNPSPVKAALGGFLVSANRAKLDAFRIPDDVVLEPYSVVALGAKELGAEFAASFGSRSEDALVTLTRSDGRFVVDALAVETPRAEKAATVPATVPDGGDEVPDGVDEVPDGVDEVPAPAAEPVAIAAGRLPDGGHRVETFESSTPGAPNTSSASRDLVINEIMYHPIPRDAETAVDGSAGQYIELYNRGSDELAVGGYRVRGGVRFDIPEGTSLAPGAYLVIAKDPAAIRREYRLSASVAIGPFEGKLSRTREEIRILDAHGALVDSVRYGDRAPWPRWADGLGSSLELRHPRLDNSLPASWEASDESSKSRWSKVQYRGRHRVFQNRLIGELQLMLLAEGECVIDDFRFGQSKNLVPEGSFERGAAAWLARGTHRRSVLAEKEGYRDSSGYRMVADGRGNTRHNNVSRLLQASLSASQTYTMSFRVRWLRGSRLLLTRLAGQGVARAHELKVPDELGSPGRENSRFDENAAPAVGTPSQFPVAPSTSESVEFRVRASTISEVVSATLKHRRDGEQQWREVTLERVIAPGPERGLESGLWQGEVPPLDVGVIEFYIEFRDSSGARGVFPPDAPLRPARYGSGIVPSRDYPTYTLLASRIDMQNLGSRARMSNHMYPATLVYNDSRIFYDVAFRKRGSPWTRGNSNWRVTFGEETLDGRRSLTVDGQGGDGTKLEERLTYWLLEQLDIPNARQQYVKFGIGVGGTSTYEDVEKIDSDFLSRWLGSSAADEPDDDGRRRSRRPARAPTEQLHKVDDYFELYPEGGRGYREAFLSYTSDDPEEYRWNFPPRSNGNHEDFEPLIDLLRLFSDRNFEKLADSMLHAETWVKVLAARTVVDDWDTLGRDRGKNAFLHRSEHDGLWRLLPWDCDLAWRNPGKPLFSSKFPGIRRLLETKRYNRQFLGYIDFLTSVKLAPDALDPVLQDFRNRTTVSTSKYSSFAQYRRDFVPRWIPRVPFRITDARRVRRSGEPDVVRVSGTAPMIAQRFELDGREGNVQFVDDQRFVADLPVGPDGGESVLHARNYGGGEIARATIRVRPRRGAMPLPERPAAESLVLRSKVPDDVVFPPVPAGHEAVVRRAPRPESARNPDPPPETPVFDAPASVAETGVIATAAPDGAAGELAPPDTRVTSEPAIDAAEIDVAPTGDSDAVEIVDVVEVRSLPATERDGAAANAATDTTDGSDGSGLVLIACLLLLVCAGGALLVLKRRGAAAVSGEPESVDEAASGRPRRLGNERLAAAAKQAQARHHDAPANDAPAKDAPAPAASPRVARALVALGASDPRLARRALEVLNARAAEDIPALIAALEDTRRTPFHRLRHVEGAFEASIADGTDPGTILVRHVAALFLRKLLGKPPVEHPGPADWQRLWASRGG